MVLEDGVRGKMYVLSPRQCSCTYMKGWPFCLELFILDKALCPLYCDILVASRHRLDTMNADQIEHVDVLLVGAGFGSFTLLNK